MTPRDTVADAHRRYRHAVERAAARILRDHDEAGDVASEAYLAMLERGPDDRRAALSWLLTTARNRALNVVRDRQRAARRPLEIPQPPADAPLVDTRQTDLVSRAMATLSERDQAAVLMRYVSEASPAEIAETLGVTVPVARVVVHRAIKRLRTQTVLLLAGHHGAGRECAARLQRQASSGIPTGHDQCGACAAVADEIAALTAHSLLPVAALPAARHAASRLQEFAASLKTHVHGWESRTAEAAAVLLIATGMVTPGATPATASRPSVAVAAPRSSTPVALPAPKPAAPGIRRIAAATPDPTTLATDAEGDTTGLVGPPPGVTVLGTTLRLPDALNGSAERGHDIRSIAAYTQAGRDGAPETLVFLLGMAEAPPRNSTFTINWTFEGTQCTGGATTQTGDQMSDQTVAWLSAACTEELGDVADLERRPASWYQTLTPSVQGGVVAVRIPLRALEDGMRELFAPGAVLSDLFAASQAGTGGVYSAVDQAPDGDEGLRYTIGSR